MRYLRRKSIRQFVKRQLTTS